MNAEKVNTFVVILKKLNNATVIMQRTSFTKHYELLNLKFQKAFWYSGGWYGWLFNAIFFKATNELRNYSLTTHNSENSLFAA